MPTINRAGAGTAVAWDDDDLELIETSAAERRRRSDRVPPVDLDPATTEAEVAAPPKWKPSPPAAVKLHGATAARENVDAWNEQGELFHRFQSLGLFDTERLSGADFLLPEAESLQAEDTDTDLDELDLPEGDTFDDVTSATASMCDELLDELTDGLAASEQEEQESPLFEVDLGGDVLDVYGKAERLAYETILQTGLDREAALPVLLDIFLESPWARTRRSIEELVQAGAGIEALALAAQIRRVWQGHPEFSQAGTGFVAGGARWYQSTVALGAMTWPAAVGLADSWTRYPDVEEVERLLEMLFEEWESRKRLRRRFLNFRFFVTYIATSVSEPLDDWLTRFFDMANGCDDPVERLEDSSWWPEVTAQLREYGIDLPRARKPDHWRRKEQHENEA